MKKTKNILLTTLTALFLILVLFQNIFITPKLITQTSTIKTSAGSGNISNTGGFSSYSKAFQIGVDHYIQWQFLSNDTITVFILNDTENTELLSTTSTERMNKDFNYTAEYECVNGTWVFYPDYTDQWWIVYMYFGSSNWVYYWEEYWYFLNDTLSVTSPTSSDSLIAGYTYDINWSWGGDFEKVNISLSYNGSFVQDIATNVENNGSFLWAVPDTMSTYGDLYQINVTNSEYANTSDASDFFEIKEYTERIFIDDSASNNWNWATNQDWCTLKNGIYHIKNLTINASSQPRDLGWMDYNGIRIKNSNKSFVIENCTILNAKPLLGDAGIILENVNNSLLMDNTVRNNINGITLINCYNNTLMSNEVHYLEDDIVLWGIRLENCRNNTLSNNNISHFSSSSGISLESCVDNKVINNTICNNLNGIVINNSSYTAILNNTASHNDNYGIRVIECVNITVENNKITENDDGLSLEDSNHNNISFNNASGNRRYGIIVDESENNTVEDNIASFNWYGISIEGEYNDVYNNTCNDNSDTGIYVYATNYNIVNNTALRNVLRGIRVYQFQGNQFTEGIIKKNFVKDCYYGITVLNVKYFTISQNIAVGNQHGIYLQTGEYGVVSFNIVLDNVEWGIYLGNADNNEVFNNTIRNSGDTGIILFSADNNYIFNNTLSDNLIHCIYVKRYCEDNIFEDNSCLPTYEDDGQGINAVAGYDMFFLLGVISIAIILIQKKLKKMS